jgi:hypothetical protein
VGAWGPALFSDDLACDVRGDYRQLLEDGVDDDIALSRTLARHSESLIDPEDGPVVILALAMTASKLGRLTPELRDRALALLDAGRGAERWDDDPKLLARRKEALGKVRAQLVGEQPARKKVRPPSRHVTSLHPGDVLALELREHDFIAIRIVRLDDRKSWVAPTVQRSSTGAVTISQPLKRSATLPISRRERAWRAHAYNRGGSHAARSLVFRADTTTTTWDS